MHRTVLKWLFLIGIGLLGLVASWTIYQDRLASEEKTRQISFNEEARIQAMQVELLFDSALAVLDAYTAFFDASDDVSRHEYDEFSDRILANRHELDGLLWMPYITQAQRASFEASLPPDKPHIVEQRAAGEAVHTAAIRDFYLPIEYAAPRALQPALIGLDVNARAVNRALRQQASTTGQRLTSAAIPDLQSANRDNIVAIYQPVYRNHQVSNDNLRGFLVLFVRPQALLRQHADLRTHSRLSLQLTDQANNAALLAHSGTLMQTADSAYVYHYPITMPGRAWHLTIGLNQPLTRSTIPEQLFICLLVITVVVVIGVERTITYLHQLQGINRHLERQKKTLDALASHDPLTGLWNRRRLEEGVEKLLTQPGDPRRLAICMLDLDNFKQVNDQQGHRRGDELLRAVADTLHVCTRQGDIVARLGGDEFVLVFRLYNDVADGSELLPLLQRLLDNIAVVATDFSQGQIPVTASMGIALSRPEHRTLAPLLHQADQAMYQAKNAGKSRYVFYPES